MAGEKMEKGMEKMEMGKGQTCECGGMCMGKVCGTISGLLVFIAGAMFLLYGLSADPPMNVMLTNQVAGAALLLFGISFMVHALRLCPLCK